MATEGVTSRAHAYGGGMHGFLFADLRGYTAFVERRGATAAAALLARYRQLVRSAVAEFEGAEIRTEGDSFYVVFPNASAAVACGLEITAAAEESNTVEPNHPIQVGVGVHAGETVETADGYVGSVVNIAARLCALAGAGEVLVSDTVRAVTAGITPVRYDSRGRHRLKGVTEPVAVFRAMAADSSPVRTRRLSFGRSQPLASSSSGRLLLLFVAIFIVGVLAVAVGGGWPSFGGATGQRPDPVAASAAAGAGPTGEMAVSRVDGDTTNIYLLDTSMPGAATRLTSEQHCRSPDWSSDGSQLAFICEEPPRLGSEASWAAHEAHFIDVGTGLSEPRQMTSFGEGAEGATDVAWQPDGTLVIAIGPTGPPFECSPLKCGLEFHDSNFVGRARTGAVLSVASSPSTGELAYVGLDPESGEPGLYALDDFGATPRVLDIGPLIPVGALDWSPDGDRIALAVESPEGTGDRDVYLYEVASGEITPLLAGPASDDAPSWSPDGRWLTYSHAIDGPPQLWAVELDNDAPPIELTEGPLQHFEAAWRAGR